MGGGTVDNIFISTWDGEIEKYLDIQQIIEQNNITIIKSKRVPSYLLQQSNDSYLLQAYQLNQALKHIPDKKRVLKCRSDFCLDILNRFFNNYSNILKLDLSIDERNVFNIDFIEKIWVDGIKGMSPFQSSDRVFFGTKEDIQKMINLDLSIMKYDMNIGAEPYFFMSPFIQRFPFLISFLNHVNYSEYCSICNQLIRNENNTIPDLVIDFWCYNYLIFQSCYKCGYLEEMKSSNFINDLNRWVDDGLINYYLNKGSEKTVLYKQFLNRLSKIKKNINQAFRMCFSKTQFIELEQWVTINGHNSPLIKHQVENTLNRNHCVLFNFGSDALNEMFNLISKSTDFRSELKQLDYNMLDEKNQEEVLLSVASRSLGSLEIKHSSKQLQFGNIEKQNEEFAAFPFLRYRSRIMNQVGNENNLVALYYYCKYSSKNNYNYQLMWIKKIKEYFKIDKFILNVDELVDYLIIGVIEGHEKLHNNKTIVNFIREIIEYPELNLFNSMIEHKHQTVNYNKSKTREILSNHKWFNERTITWYSNRSFDEDIYLENQNVTDYYSIIQKQNQRDKIIELIQKAEENEKTELIKIVAHEYYIGRNIPVNLEKAANLYFKAMTMGSEATREMLYSIDDNNNPEHQGLLLYFLNKNADKGDKYSAYLLGRKYHRGKGVSKNLEKALYWLRKSKSLMFANAATELFDTLWEINTPEAYEEMIQVATDFAAKGDGGAMGRLGRAYRDGKGVNKDLEIAAEWFKRASDTGILWTKHALLDTLWEIGTIDAYTEMVNIASTLASKGDKTAMKYLWKAYNEGKGVQQNTSIATNWLEKAHTDDII